MNKPTKPNIVIPESFAENGIKTDFDNEKLTNGFDRLQPDVLAGDNLNKFIDDTYKGLNYGIAAADAINLIQEGETLTVQNGELVSGSTGGGLEVCDIGMALFVDESKGLRRYLNGQIVDINTNTQAFLDRLLQIQTTNPDYFTTEDNWQAEALLNVDGCVYKFVLNYSGDTVVSVRLPKYPDYVEINAGGTLPVVGNGMTLGLTNGSGYGGIAPNASNKTTYICSEVYGQPVGATNGSTSFGYSMGVTTDPAKSGIQTTLKQTKLKMRYFIQIATGAETENNIINTLENVNGFTLLESKYSDKPLYNESWLLSNGQYNPKGTYPTVYEGLQVEYNTEIEAGTTVTLPSGTSYTKRGLSVKLWTDESATDYDFRINTADETFRLPLLDGSEDLPSDRYIDLELTASGTTYIAPANGWVNLRKVATAVGQYISLVTNAERTTGAKQGFGYNNWISNSAVNNALETTVPVKKDEKVEIGYNAGGTTEKFRFWYAQGNGSLYFYVGETVQNANLIDAGRIGEVLPTKTDKVQAARASMPSDKYIDLAVGISGTTYTAPANGWFSVFGVTSSTQAFIGFKNTTSGLNITNAYYGSGINGWSSFMPAKKGDVVLFGYNNLLTSHETFYLRFYYAEGSKED
ncbi:MAG: hypothetical protein ACI37Q_04310 [Candidatus Gastranaerophilaceae bacterium]